MPMIPFCPTCAPPSGCGTKPPGKCVLYSGVYLSSLDVLAGQNLDDILGKINTLIGTGLGGLTIVSTQDSSSISFSGEGTIGNPLSAEFIGTIPSDTNIYNTSGTISGVQRVVTGEYSSGLTFSWKDQFGTPDQYIIGVNTGGGGGRVRVLGPTGSLIINEQDLRIGSAGTSTTQAYLQINMTDFNFVFGADPTIVNIKQDGLYLPTTLSAASLATDGTGKVIPGASIPTPSLQETTDIGATTTNGITITNTGEQLRLAYDGSNYMSTVIGSDGDTTFSLTGTTSPVFTYAQPIIASGAIYTRVGSREGSNFFAWAGGGGTQTSDLGLKLGSSLVAVKAAFNGTTSTVPIIDYSFGSVVIGSGAWTTAASSGPHPIGANLVVKAPNITKNVVDVTLAASIYIDAAPTIGLSNYSLYVAAGLSYFGGQIQTQGTTEQLRIGYDVSNYMSTTVGSTGNVTLGLTGTNPKFLFQQAAVFMGGLNTANTSLFTVSNFGALGGNTALAGNVTTGILFGGATAVTGRAFFNGNTTTVIGSGQNAANVIIGQNAFTENLAGTHPLIANLVVVAPTVTDSTATTTTAASLYIDGPPIIAATNYSLMVASGNSYFGGQIKVAGGTPGINKVLTDVDGTGLAVWSTPTVGGTVTSVSLSLPSIITVTGNPITTSGTITGTLATQTANTTFAGPPSGGDAAPTFRTLVAADIPSLASSYIQNQSSGDQTANFRINGTARIGGFVNIGSTTIPSSPLTVTYNSGNQLILAYNSSTQEITNVGSTGIVTKTASGSAPSFLFNNATEIVGVLTNTATTTQHFLRYDAGHYESITVASTGSTTYDLVGTSPTFTFGKGVSVTGVLNTTGRITPTLITEQMRVAYDASNYMSFVVASNGSTTIDLTGTSPLFSFGKGTSFTAGIAANNVGFNLSVVSINGGNSVTTSQYLFAGAATINYRVGIRGSGANTLAAGSSGTNFIVADNNLTTAASGTTALLANAVIKAPTIVVTAGSTVTNTASLYIDAAPTGGTNNYALLIGAGDFKTPGNSITGGQKVGYTTWSTSTQTATTSMYFLEYTGSISSTLTLPAVATNIGQMYFFENNGSGTVTVSPGIWNQTGGGTTITSYGPASSFFAISNGTNWVRIV